MKKLLVVFRHVTNIHLKKDVGLFPIYLSKYFDETELVSVYNEKQECLPDHIRNVKIRKIFTIKKYSYVRRKQLVQNLVYARRLIKTLCEDGSVTHIMLFHWDLFHLFIISKVKHLCPNVKLYLKLDSSIEGAKNILSQTTFGYKGLKGLLFNGLIKRGIKTIDLITAETVQTYELLKTSELLAKKICLVPNGYDDELYIKPVKEKKEKVIITCGRLGSFPKNTELFFKIIKTLNLKEWKIKLIGPIETGEKDFQKNIDEFFLERPDLKDKVIFTGAISNSKELRNEYQKASVFVLTSRFESSGIVLLEAAINGCYICTTDVGVARDLKYCFVSPNSTQNNQNEDVILKSLSVKLQQLIDNQELCFENFQERTEFYKETLLMSKVVEGKHFKNFANI